MREEDKSLPTIIDIAPTEMIDVGDSQVEIDEMPIDFELREPETEAYGQQETIVQKEKIIKQDSTTKQQTNEHQYDDARSNNQEKSSQESKRESESYTSNKSEGEADRDKSQSKERKKSEDTSFKAFKSKQYENERRWRKQAGGKLKQLLSLMLLILVGIPLLTVGVGTTLFVGGFGLFFGAMIFGMGILGVGIAAFLTTTGTGAVAAIAGYASVLMIGLGGLALLLIGRILMAIVQQTTKGYQKMKNNKREDY